MTLKKKNMLFLFFHSIKIKKINFCFLKKNSNAFFKKIRDFYLKKYFKFIFKFSKKTTITKQNLNEKYLKKTIIFVINLMKKKKKISIRTLALLLNKCFISNLRKKILLI